MFKVGNRNTTKRCEICSKITIKTPKRRQWRCSGVSIVNYEHISHLFLKSLYPLTWRRFLGRIMHYIFFTYSHIYIFIYLIYSQFNPTPGYCFGSYKCVKQKDFYHYCFYYNMWHRCWFSSAGNLEGTLMQIWISANLFAFIWK